MPVAQKLKACGGRVESVAIREQLFLASTIIVVLKAVPRALEAPAACLLSRACVVGRRKNNQKSDQQGDTPYCRVFIYHYGVGTEGVGAGMDINL